MTKIIKAERRISPRIAQQLPINVIANGYDFATSTKNISCVGAYCHIAKYVPPFTKVNIKLNLPLADMHNRRGISVVECKGVIVRAEDEASGGFNVAIFFNGITDSCRKKISQYVNQFVS
ncbi:MAG: PilZ domain-containing protein [Candidatus Omnitrophota bacterium]